MNKAEQLIACLEGEIAKRDEGLAECRVAVENCELFRARIAELERQLNSDKLIKMVAELRAELAAVKAQWAAMPKSAIMVGRAELALVRSALALDCEQGRPVRGEMLAELDASIARLDKSYAAPVSEAEAQGVYSTDPLACSGCASGCFRCRDGAKAQGVVMPERANASHGSHDHQSGWNACIDEIARLNAAPSAPAADAGLVEALENVLKSGRGSSGRIILDEEDEAEARSALAAHRAKGVV